MDHALQCVVLELVHKLFLCARHSCRVFVEGENWVGHIFSFLKVLKFNYNSMIKFEFSSIFNDLGAL